MLRFLSSLGCTKLPPSRKKHKKMVSKAEKHQRLVKQNEKTMIKIGKKLRRIVNGKTNVSVQKKYVTIEG